MFVGSGYSVIVQHSLLLAGLFGPAEAAKFYCPVAVPAPRFTLNSLKRVS